MSVRLTSDSGLYGVNCKQTHIKFRRDCVDQEAVISILQKDQIVCSTCLDSNKIVLVTQTVISSY